MEIEADLLRVIVDINIGRCYMIDEITIREIEHARFMHPPRTGEGIRNREANIGPIVMREVEVIPAGITSTSRITMGPIFASRFRIPSPVLGGCMKRACSISRIVISSII